MDEYFCRTCGFMSDTSPFYTDVDDTLYPSYDICPCCFSEAGYDDGKGYRKEWLENGAKFNEVKFKPNDWSYEKALNQIKNIPEKYLNQTSENL